ncbi:hypothetical protein FA95DRAFT_672472 [Auriscalpium vulgare]|uniref:Uncharacterized protein n=1 Tax=Auriscalpium vulgare TaxID=40419 RepID=A0ACB8RCS4_9AGAM|nr:hypothetical protein FA95DRAFT_672472 [Auriscalpium vulgare]
MRPVSSARQQASTIFKKTTISLSSLLQWLLNVLCAVLGFVFSLGRTDHRFVLVQRLLCWRISGGLRNVMLRRCWAHATPAPRGYPVVLLLSIVCSSPADTTDIHIYPAPGITLCFLRRAQNDSVDIRAFRRLR